MALFYQMVLTACDYFTELNFALNHKHVELATLISYLFSFAKCNLIRMISASAICCNYRTLAQFMPIMIRNVGVDYFEIWQKLSPYFSPAKCVFAKFTLCMHFFPKISPHFR